MFKIKIIATLIVIISLFLIINYSSNGEQNSISHLTKAEPLVGQKQDVPSYKDIFKDKTREHSLEEYESAQHMKEIQEKSQKLIAEVDLMIKNKHLTLPHKEASEEDKEKMQLVHKQLDKLKQQLEELHHEN